MAVDEERVAGLFFVGAAIVFSEVVKPLLCSLVSTEPHTLIALAVAAFIHDIVGVVLLASAVYYVFASVGTRFYDVFSSVVAPCLVAGGAYVLLSLASLILDSFTVYIVAVLVCYAGLAWSQILGPAAVAARAAGGETRRYLLPSLAAYTLMMAVGLPFGFFLGLTMDGAGTLYACRVIPGYSAALPSLAAKTVAITIYILAAKRLLARRAASGAG